MSLRSRLLSLGFGLGAALAAGGETSLPPTAIAPGVEVIRTATLQGLPLDGFELGGAGPVRPGDRLTVLFTIEEPGRPERQWLAEFRAVPLTAREAGATPGSGLGIMGLFFSSLKTDTGHEHRFPGTPAALVVRTFGPFAAGGASAPAERSERVIVTREYLARGLAAMSEIELRLRAAGKQNPGLSYMFRPSYPAEQMAAAKIRAAEAGFTVQDERINAEGFLALVQFAHLALRTDGIEAITREMIDAPGLFSGTFINPDWADLTLVEGAPWGLPGMRIFRMPYAFHSKTEARGAFFVTAPQPPLQNMAGLVGLTVDETSKVPGKRLVMRVLAGRRGPP